MSTKSDQTAKLKTVVRGAMLNIWDPIGISQFPEAQDEYDAYVLDLCGILAARGKKDEIFAYLWQLETSHMGLNGDREATKRFAITLHQIGEDFMNSPAGHNIAARRP